TFSYLRAEGERVLEVWQLPNAAGADECKRCFEASFHKSQFGRIMSGLSGQGGPVLSPDGRVLVYSNSSDGLAPGGKCINHVVDLGAGKVAKFEDPISSNLGASSVAAVSPNGDLLALREPGGLFYQSRDIVVVDRKGHVVFRLLGHLLPPVEVAFSPDGQRL